MDERDLKKIEARHTKATPGKWSVWHWLNCQVHTAERDCKADPRSCQGHDTYGVTSDGGYVEIGSMEIGESDADFIAAAHADIPTLIAEVRRLRAVVKQLDRVVTRAPRKKAPKA